MKTKLFLISLLFVALGITSCNKEHEREHLGLVELHFSHSFNQEPLEFDVLSYENEAGNKIMVNEIQYFLSDIDFITKTNEKNYISPSIHYIDTDIKSTHQLTASLPVDTYKAIEFTFGLSEAHNVSGSMPNAPERDMYWPERLGGGYHYMKLNGKYDVGELLPDPFNFHLGPGLNENGEAIHQSFTVTLPLNKEILIEENGAAQQITLDMNIANWFRNPNKWDIKVFGPKIMENQAAMKAGLDNGKEDVFSVQQ